EVGLRIPDRLNIRYSKHTQVHLLSQIRCVRLPAHSPKQECLQHPAVFREQPFDQRFPCLSHGLLSMQKRKTIDPTSLRVSGWQFGYLKILQIDDLSISVCPGRISGLAI